MANFLRTVVIQNTTISADGQVVRDLPVNPLSMILVTLRAAMAAADVTTTLASLYGLIDSLAVRFRGQDIIRGTLRDLAMLNSIVAGAHPWGYRTQDAATEVVTLTVPICFGRRPFSVVECFPAVRRGDLTLELNADIAEGNLDSLALQVETVELLDETPERYLKYTSSGQTFSTTGEEVVRLPIGNPLLGVLLFGTTVPTAAARTATWERLRFRLDHVETAYAQANWDSIHGELARQGLAMNDFVAEHQHRYTGAAAGFANSLQQQRATDCVENYGYLDFDPMKDGSFMIVTAGRADVEIVRQAGTADAARFTPVELVEVRAAA